MVELASGGRRGALAQSLRPSIRMKQDSAASHNRACGLNPAQNAAKSGPVSPSAPDSRGENPAKPPAFRMRERQSSVHRAESLPAVRALFPKGLRCFDDLRPARQPPRRAPDGTMSCACLRARWPCRRSSCCSRRRGHLRQEGEPMRAPLPPQRPFDLDLEGTPKLPPIVVPPRRRAPLRPIRPVPASAQETTPATPAAGNPAGRGHAARTRRAGRRRGRGMAEADARPEGRRRTGFRPEREGGTAGHLDRSGHVDRLPA